jgi:hypothetical protein
MQYTNNLKQLALALHNYHDTKNEFPAGCTTLFEEVSGSPQRRFSALSTLCPFIEQGAVVMAALSQLGSSGTPSMEPWGNQWGSGLSGKKSGVADLSL